MKYIVRIAALCVAFFAFMACHDEESEPQPQYLPVTTANLNGTWQLTEWNGKQTTDTWYYYITFDRKEETFVSYERMNSMKGEKRTGSFAIEQPDTTTAYILSGSYDYGKGDWTHKYEVSQMTENSMTLTATDNKEDVQKFIRVDAVPADIQKGTRSK